MKGLRDLAALKTAPALEEFAFIDARGKEPAQLLPALRNPVVRRVSAGFGSEKKNEEFARLREEHGKAPPRWVRRRRVLLIAAWFVRDNRRRALPIRTRQDRLSA